MHYQSHFPIPANSRFRYAASGVILNESDEILLFLHDGMPLWTNIGGGLEDGEDFETALHREAFEETGARIAIERFVGDFFSPKNDGSYFHEKVYVCRPVPGEQPKHQTGEGVKLEWFAKDKLPFNMGPRYRFRILQAFADNDEPVALVTPGPNTIEFLQSIRDFSNFVALDEWGSHPTVMQKRQKGLLRFDPPL